MTWVQVKLTINPKHILTMQLDALDTGYGRRFLYRQSVTMCHRKQDCICWWEKNNNPEMASHHDNIRAILKSRTVCKEEKLFHIQAVTIITTLKIFFFLESNWLFDAKAAKLLLENSTWKWKINHPIVKVTAWVKYKVGKTIRTCHAFCLRKRCFVCLWWKCNADIKSLVPEHQIS